MSAATPPVTRILVAENPADGAGQDRVFTLPHAVIVLDGASSPDPQPRDGGWYADTLGTTLQQCLQRESEADLRALLAHAITDVAARYSLQPGTSPSSTVAILRWTDQRVDALVLGDSPVIVRTSDGQTHELHDARLSNVAAGLRHRIEARLREGHGYTSGHDQLLRRLVALERAARNTPGGYWIAEATPAAAEQALVGVWNASDVEHAFLLTDGASRAVTLFGTYSTWAEAMDIIRAHGPRYLCNQVRTVEAADHNGQHWPRSKAADDQAAVHVEFLPAAALRLPGDTCTHVGSGSPSARIAAPANRTAQLSSRSKEH